MSQQHRCWAYIPTKFSLNETHAPACSLQLYSQQPRHEKNPNCPLTIDWIKKMWYIYTMEYYSAIKKNEIMLFAATWMELETLILREERKRQIPYDIIYI